MAKTIADIEALVGNTEGKDIEFKLTTGQLERGMETLCAFLNGNGGTVLFGVDDKGNIVGQEVADSTKRAIAEAIRHIEPFATINVSYVDIDGENKSVIAIYAEDQSYMRPFSYKGRAYIRTESTTSIMSQEQFSQLLMQRGGTYSWETMPNYELKLSDLDEATIVGAVRGGIRCGRLPETTIREDITSILGKFNLMHNGVLNNASAVLFGKDFYFYPQCVLRLKIQGHNKERVHRQSTYHRQYLYIA